ncbi:MAG: acetate--CoA ligase family protein [Candidatus Dormibacter sp.]
MPASTTAAATRPAAEISFVLQPRSIAIVGASDDPGRIGGRPIRILGERGFAGSVYPVNPKYQTVQGLRCYPDIPSLPSGVEMYIICLAAGSAVEALEQAGDNGARAAVIFSGGFSETGPDGQRLQARLADIATRYGIALVGPNCLGVASFAHRSYATFATTLETLPPIDAGDIALVAQSGGSAFNLFTESYWGGARFSHVIATGNEAGITFADYLAHLADDPSTRAVIGYLEGAANGDRLAQALDALHGAGKPVFLLKAGGTARGAVSVASHTAQMSGDDSAFAALFERYGVVRLETMEETIDVAVGLSMKTAADGLVVATNSGGGAVYLADVSERYDVPLAPLTEQTRAALAAELPDFAGLANPIDFTAQVINDRSLLGRTLQVLDCDPTVDALLVFLGSMEYLSDELLGVLVDARARLGKPLALAWLGVHERVRVAAREAGLIAGGDPARLLRGLSLVRAGRAALARDPGTAGEVPPATPDIGDVSWLRDLVPRTLDGGRQGLDEWQAMALLDRRGLPTPARRRVSSPEEAEAAASEIGGACVLKLLDPLIAHRAKVGAVRTGLSDPQAVRVAFEEMQRDHSARLALIAEQIPPGPELILGVLADATFGTRAVLGSGGVWANELADGVTLVPPYTDTYVAARLAGLRQAARIAGEGNATDRISREVAANLRGLAAIVADSAGTITEIECNPVVVTDQGLRILDALAFVRGARTEQDSRGAR